MDAFYEEDTPLLQLEDLAVVFPQSRHKVVFRDIYFLTVYKGHDIPFHEGVVNGLKIIEVIGAVRELGGVHAVHKIVVGGH